METFEPWEISRMPTIPEAVVGYKVETTTLLDLAGRERFNGPTEVIFYPEPVGDVPLWQTSNSRYTDPEGVVWRPIVGNGHWIRVRVDDCVE